MLLGISIQYMNVIFEIIMAFVLCLISLQSYSIFKLSKENKYKWFSYSFFAIALAFAGRILMNIVIHTQNIRKIVAGAVIVTFNNTGASSILWNYGLFTYRIFMLVGLLGIFLIITNSKEKKNWLLLFYLAISTALASMHIKFMFSLTCAIILGLISLQFYQNYKIRPKKSSFGVALSFYIIFLSHAIFIFEQFDHSLFVVGEVVQLAGYILLLAVYVSILRK
jgi:hypothetical protein